MIVRFWFGMLHWICSFWGVGQAWPRSKHAGSLLPNTLRGKSPCLGAESATGRPEDLYSGAVSEALVELWFWCLVLCSSKVMPWAFARTPTERGSLFPCLPPADVRQSWHRKPVLTSSLGWYHVIAFFHLWLQTIQLQQKTPAGMRCDSFYLWHLIRQLQQYRLSTAACTFLTWNVALNVQLLSAFGGQDKHGHAANTQGACSQIRCGESPRALGQKVALGDQKTFTLEPSAKLWWSCGSGVLSFAAAKLCHERLQERQLNGAHSFHASLLQMSGKAGIASQSWLPVLDDTTW